MSSENSTAQMIVIQRINQRSAFDNTFEDALALVTDTRDLLAEKSVSLRSALQLSGQSEQLQEVVILSKLTLCLIHIMDWVVAQKISIDNADRCCRELISIPQLDDLSSFPSADEAYSERVNYLINRTLLMFARVMRLNENREAVQPTGPVAVVSGAYSESE